MDAITKAMLPPWADPEALLHWTEANRAWIAFGMAILVMVVLVLAVLLRKLYDRINTPKEFGAARWSDEKKLRKQKRLKTDFT